MPIRGPLATLIAVVAAGAAVVTTNVVLTAEPSDVAQPAAALSSTTSGYAAHYDGRSAGDEVTVQVTVENGQATAYLCNADSGIETWVRGTAADGRMQLRGDDGASVEATSDGTAVFGTASAKGRSWPFSAAVVTEPAAPAAAPAPGQPAPVEQQPVDAAPVEQQPADPAPAAPQQDSYGGY